ncbi:hybrid sensor histidine kinase/response regulator transcription factor [Pedobacter glucosidilyticus]|uniref:hybrid sensor histidine kinase/response regulator transcription factor n=1 Tax=Pedobacter glucosidilyticus TaxID=1122941 RepID=UPI0005602BB0|nr:hybrid sensor histidine kinase/response regulator transcription factor [Pedobacter glucosidilyticus]
MTFNKGIILALFFVFVLNFSNSIKAQIKFQHLSVEDGLSQSSVLSITQDGTGFMWFGCRYGLNKYDGKKFKIYYHHDDSKRISPDNKIKVYRGKQKKIWAISFSGLDVYNEELDTFTRFYNSSILKCFLQDQTGRIWLGTQNGLIFSEDSSNSKFTLFPLTSDHQRLIINVLFEDNQRRIWIGTNKGLFCIKNSKVAYYPYYQNQLTSIETDVTSLAQDIYQNLWIGTKGKGVSILNIKTGRFIRRFSQQVKDVNSIPSNDIFKIISSKTGYLWIGTQDGLSVINPHSYKIITYRNTPSDIKSLSQNSVYDLFEDQNGSIWIGTYYGGINIVHKTPFSFKVYAIENHYKNLNVNVISALYEDNHKKLWVGTESSGLNYFSKDFKKLKTYQNNIYDFNSISSNSIKCIIKDNEGRLWIATHKGGLNLFNQKSGHFVSYKTNPKDSTTIDADNIYTILQDSKNRFWIGTGYGLSLFNPKTGKFKRSKIIAKEYRVPGSYVMNIFEDSQKNLYVCNLLGIHILKENSKFFKLLPYALKAGLNSNQINYMYEDSKKRIWIANYYGGITLFNPATLAFKTYNINQKLSNNNVVGILEDNKGMLWLSTNNGLVRFDVDKKEFHNYDQKDGLPSNEFNKGSCLKLKDGTLLFGGYKGIVSFNPDDIKVNTFVPPVLLSDLKLFDKSVKVNGLDNLLKKSIIFTDNLIFKYNQNSFSLEFATLNYIQADKNKYAYKLEGYDRRWHYSTAAYATYNNLPPGKYKFLVKASNNNGVWTTNIKELSIQILNPPWKSVWAYFLYFVVILIILILLIRYLNIRIRLKREEEMHKLKLDFFTNISHEIRTPLTLIKAPIEELISSSNENIGQMEYLMQVKNNTDRLLRLVTELMDFRKIEAGKVDLEVQEHNLVDFLNDIYNSFSILARNKKITYSFYHDVNSLNIYFDKSQLEKVFFNLLSNAFKFTSDGGEIVISIKDSTNVCIIEIADNGCGIAEDDHKNLFRKFFQSKLKQLEAPGSGIGLALSKSILELHKGTINFKSKLAQDGKNGYTIFQVELLKGVKHFDKNSFKQSVSLENYKLINDVDLINEDVIDFDTEFGNVQILVIEDNDEIREYIRSSLNKSYNIETAENGAIGIEKAFESLPDLIISDVKMPEKDGLELCKILKSNETTSHIPIILLTARTTFIQQLSGLENGADVYLTKPFSLQILRLNIKNLLATRKAMRERFSKEMTFEPTKVIINHADEKFLKRLMLIVEDHIDDSEFDVEQLIDKVGMSRRVLYKKLSALTNMTAADFIKSIRLKKAVLLLENGGFNVSEVAFAVGFNDPKYFTKSFKKQFGKSPREYQNSLKS